MAKQPDEAHGHNMFGRIFKKKGQITRKEFLEKIMPKVNEIHDLVEGEEATKFNPKAAQSWLWLKTVFPDIDAEVTEANIDRTFSKSLHALIQEINYDELASIIGEERFDQFYMSDDPTRLHAIMEKIRQQFGEDEEVSKALAKKNPMWFIKLLEERFKLQELMEVDMAEVAAALNAPEYRTAVRIAADLSPESKMEGGPNMLLNALQYSPIGYYMETHMGYYGKAARRHNLSSGDVLSRSTDISGRMIASERQYTYSDNPGKFQIALKNSILA